MTKNHIKYKSGYKYQLTDDCCFEIALALPEGFRLVQYYFQLRPISPEKTVLEIFKGYAWDGASGPTWDDKTNIRASLVHDVLYQMMREGFLSQNCRKQADMIFKDICLEDGMGKIRSWYYYQAVRNFAMSSVKPKNKRKILTAP